MEKASSADSSSVESYQALSFLCGRPAGRGFGCLSVWLWRLPPSARWGARNACSPARRAVTQMAATKATAQMGAPEDATQAAARRQQFGR